MPIAQPTTTDTCIWTFQNGYWTVIDMCPAGKGCLDDFVEAIQVKTAGNETGLKATLTPVTEANGKTHVQITVPHALFVQTVRAYFNAHGATLNADQNHALDDPDHPQSQAPTTTIQLPCVPVIRPYQPEQPEPPAPPTFVPPTA